MNSQDYDDVWQDLNLSSVNYFKHYGSVKSQN